MRSVSESWFAALARVTADTVVTGDYDFGLRRPNEPQGVGRAYTLDQGILQIREAMRRTRMTFLIGNGGSAAIASHMQVDFNLAGLRSMTLNDPVPLTSHGNDFGFEATFSKQLEWYGQANDILIAMSCSGKSPNILDAVRFANAQGMGVITFSGFEPDNPLRLLGELNFYVPAWEYGFVQIAHESILHAACDIEAGWGP